MKKRKIAIVTASAVMTLAVSVGAAACGGSLKMTDFVVNPQNAKTVYAVGDTVSFDALEMKAFFNDDSTDDVALSEVKIYLGEEEITTNLSKITETKGVKTIKVVYTTKYGEDYAEFTVTVNEEIELLNVTGFNEPTFLSDFKANTSAATNDKTDANFEQKFFKNEGTEYYVVGDDNAFKFLPVVQVFDEEEFSTETLTAFKANSTVKVLEGESFVALEKKAKANAEFVYEYYKGETLYVTEDAANNTFNFADGTVDKVFNISVKPDLNYYDFDADAVEVTVKIVDAYNVYKASELSVFDNTQTEWNAIKTANGIANVTTNGVVLHQNTLVTENDIPQDFYYTLPANYNIKYKNATTGQVGAPEDFGLTRTFIWNQYDGNPVIYQRTLQAGEHFAFYGNYFDLDVSKMPLVCSFWPEGNYGETDTYYGGDFSNTSLFRAEGQAPTEGESDEHFNFYNLAMKGNAKVDQIILDDATTGKDKGDHLIYAGGLIFAKTEAVTAQFDNTRAYNFFIGMLAEAGADVTTEVNYNRTKIYDSFQDALFLWGKIEATITNSYFKRAGGPLVIMNHVDPANNSTRVPKLTIGDECEMEAYLTGNEIWFNSVGGSMVIENFKGLDQLALNPMGKTIFGGPKNSMNIIALLMCDTADAQVALTQTGVQGKISYKDTTLDKMADEGASMETILGGQVPPTTGNLVAAIQQINASAPIFGVGDSLYYFNGSQIINPLTNSDGSAEMYTKSIEQEYLAFYNAGISIFFGYQNLAA